MFTYMYFENDNAYFACLINKNKPLNTLNQILSLYRQKKTLSIDIIQ